ncbi:DUF2953 domain-containing protein [Phosphitispora sp. TUW77]|uniref:DUF2953 domain-containing protein n=1 Tax=Phosphitispora sp. TUW77 TaxID=3152361 RepID=UPI003AB371AB
MTGYFIFAVILLVLFAALFIKVSCEISFVRKKKNDHLKIEISVFKGIIRYKAEMPVFEINNKPLQPMVKVKTEAEGVSPSTENKGRFFEVPLAELLLHLPRNVKWAFEYLERYRKAVKHLIKSVRLRQLSWKTEIGVGDPAYTGIAAGFLWAVKGMGYGIIRRNVRTDNAPVFSVLPCYCDTCFRVEFHCIFDLRIGNIIVAGLNFAKCRIIHKRHRGRI